MAELAPAPSQDAVPPLPAALDAAAAPPAEAWSPAARVAFRFGFCFAVLIYWPFPLGTLPLAEKMGWLSEEATRSVFIWLTQRLLHPPPEELPLRTGSGDALYEYVRVGTVVVLAAVAAAVWTALARRHAEHRTLAAWLVLGLRAALFTALASYGFIKVFSLQMPWDPARLIEPVGQMSPMGLLWTFVSAAPGYETFSGWAEVIAGLLLLSRRTATLGALMAIAVMGNVVAFNFFYDVPVKLYSLQLWLTAVAIAAPDAGRLFRLLVQRHPVEPAPFVPLVRSPRWARLRKPALALAVLWAGWIVYDAVTGPFQFQKRWRETESKFPLLGLYQVESFTAPADAAAGSPFAGSAWAQVGSTFGRISVLRADGSFGHLGMQPNQDGTVKLTPFGGQESAVVHLERLDPDHARLWADGFEVKLKTIPESSFNLRGRGFRWVQANPFNR